MYWFVDVRMAQKSIDIAVLKRWSICRTWRLRAIFRAKEHMARETETGPARFNQECRRRRYGRAQCTKSKILIDRR